MGFLGDRLPCNGLDVEMIVTATYILNLDFDGKLGAEEPADGDYVVALAGLVVKGPLVEGEASCLVLDDAVHRHRRADGITPPREDEI